MSNKLTVNFKLVNLFTNPDNLSTAEDELNFNKILQLLDGTGAGKAEAIYHAQRTLGVSANEELDLNGVLTGAFGVAKDFTKLKALVVYAAVGNTNNVLVGGAATNAVPIFSDVTDKAVVKPGGMFFLFDPSIGGYTVTPATGDLLRIENSAGGTSVTYDIIVVGEIT